MFGFLTSDIEVLERIFNSVSPAAKNKSCNKFLQYCVTWNESIHKQFRPRCHLKWNLTGSKENPINHMSRPEEANNKPVTVNTSFSLLGEWSLSNVVRAVIPCKYKIIHQKPSTSTLKAMLLRCWCWYLVV